MIQNSANERGVPSSLTIDTRRRSCDFEPKVTECDQRQMKTDPAGELIVRAPTANRRHRPRRARRPLSARENVSAERGAARESLALVPFVHRILSPDWAPVGNRG
ncbi:hypothetical protein ACWGB8_35080 [Kitasatospora sp. NPDC054939]